MIDAVDFEEEYDGPQDLGADGWVESRSEEKASPVNASAPQKKKKIVHLRTVPVKLRGHKIHGTVRLAIWDMYAGRAEVIADFPIEYRNGPAILTLMNYMYPTSPDDVGINRYMNEFFSKVLDADFSDPEKLKQISSIADLEHRKMEIDAVVDVGTYGRSYYRIIAWEFIEDKKEDAKEPPIQTESIQVDSELEHLKKENKELLDKVARLERKIKYWKGTADRYWRKIKELIAPSSYVPTPPPSGNAVNIESVKDMI